MNNIENIQEYIPTVYVNDSEPDLDETNLNKTEQAIKRVTDAANKAIDALKQLDREKLALSAISNVLSDATDKVPSLALANTMQLAINDLNSNLSNVSDTATTANAKVTLNGVKNINGFTSVYPDRVDRAIQLQYDSGEIASITFNNTGLAYDFYNGATWEQVWKFNRPT